jgi:hypothetical protein
LHLKAQANTLFHYRKAFGAVFYPKFKIASAFHQNISASCFTPYEMRTTTEAAFQENMDTGKESVSQDCWYA